jgi:hypothetical protein
MGPGIYASGPTKAETIPLSTAGKIVGELSRALNMVSRVKPGSKLLSTGNVMALNRFSDIGSDWNPNANGSVLACALSGSGSILYVGGNFTTIGGQSRNRLAAIDVNSGEVLPWNPNVTDVNGCIYTILVANYGSGEVIFVGGYFTHVGGAARYSIAALDPVTGSALPFDAEIDSNGYVYTLAFTESQTVGKMLLIGGRFESVGNETRVCLGAVAPDTGQLLDWGVPIGSGGMLLPMLNVIYPYYDHIYIGGDFLLVGNETRHYIAELRRDDGQPTAWAPILNGTVHDITVINFAVYVAGAFDSVGDKRRSRFAAINPDSGVALAWNPDANYAGYKILLMESMVILAGAFTEMGGQPRTYLAGVDQDHGDLYSWNPSIVKEGQGGSAISCMVAKGGILYIGGTFYEVCGATRNKLAAILLDDLHSNLLALRDGIEGLFDAEYSRVWKDDNKADHWDNIAELLTAGSFGAQWLPLRPQDSRIYTQIRECLDNIRGLSWNILPLTSWHVYTERAAVSWADALAASLDEGWVSVNGGDVQVIYFRHNPQWDVLGQVINHEHFGDAVAVQMYANPFSDGDIAWVYWDFHPDGYDPGRRGLVVIGGVSGDDLVLSGGYGDLYPPAHPNQSAYLIDIASPDYYSCRGCPNSPWMTEAIKAYWGKKSFRATAGDQFLVRFCMTGYKTQGSCPGGGIEQTINLFAMSGLGNTFTFFNIPGMMTWGPMVPYLVEKDYGWGEPLDNYLIYMYTENLNAAPSPFDYPADPKFAGPFRGESSIKMAPIWVDNVPDDWFWR